MRLLLIRHGETDWNATLRYQGPEVPLNERGRIQARRAAERLRSTGLAIQALYASDMQRAWETAHIVSDVLQLTPFPLPELREIDAGQWVGLTPAELNERFPDHMEAYRRDPAGTVRLGGESYHQLQQRALVALEQIHAWHQTGDIVLIVAHGGTIRTLICHALRLDLRHFGQMWLDNGSLSELRHDAQHGWRVYRLNDVAHLEGLVREGGE